MANIGFVVQGHIICTDSAEILEGNVINITFSFLKKTTMAAPLYSNTRALLYNSKSRTNKDVQK